MSIRYTIKSFIKAVILVIVLFFLGSISFGQQVNYNTKIKDGSVAHSLAYSLPNAVLELESTNKGFLLPRMTTSERDAIKINNVIRGNGLSIYNTDMDCINYWSTTANKWLSLCGTLPPAVIDLEGGCSNIRLVASGGENLKQGQFLRASDILYIRVKVEEAGTYNISATTDNGYFFTGEGRFEVAGIYSVGLEGMGTPMSGSPKGDIITFNINGKVSNSCSDFRIVVDNSPINYTVVEPQSNIASGDAYIGVALNANTNRVTLQVNVHSVGFWNIRTAESDNGISFGGSGEFIETGLQTVTLVGQGIPLSSGTSSFKVVTNSDETNAPNSKVLGINVLPTSFEIICDAINNPIEIRGEYKEDTQLGNTHRILVPITVKAPGKTTISLSASFVGANSNTSFEFKAEDVNLLFDPSNDNIQFVSFAANGVTIPRGTKQIVLGEFKSDGYVVTCTDLPKIDVEEQDIRYEIDCNEVGVKGNYIVGSDINANTNYIVVKLNVDYPGPYSIETDTINGVSFKANGTFENKGIVTVNLLPQGKFTEGGNLNYTITTNSKNGNTTCFTNINVRYRDITILRLGSTNYGPNTGTSWAGGAIINSKTNFGPNGTVKVRDIKVLGIGTRNATVLRNFLKENKVDIIFNVVGYNATTAVNNVLYEFITIDKGVLIVGDERRVDGTTRDLIEQLAGGKLGDITNDFTTVNPIVASSLDPIINGPFGDLTGRYMGNNSSRGWYFSGLPSTLTPLVSKDGNSSEIWSLRHNSLGYVFIGDGGWIAGRINNTNNTNRPALFSTSGVPIGKPNYGRENRQTVYNSVYYANILAWAINYINQNKPN